MFNPQRILTVLLIACITLALLEVVLRITGLLNTHYERQGGKYISQFNQRLPSWYLTGKPSSQMDIITSEFSYHHAFDTAGLLQSLPSAADTTALKILIMGDSFTFGVGAPQDSSWARLFEARLHTSGRAVHLKNAAMPGGDPFFASVLYRDRLAAWKPDIILLCLNSTDLFETYVRGGFGRFQPDGTILTTAPPWYEALYQHSHAARLLMKLFAGIQNDYLYQDKDIEQIYLSSMRQIDSCLATMCAEAGAQQARLIAFSFPLPVEIKENEHDIFYAYSRDFHSLPCFSFRVDSLIREFYKTHPVENYYWKGDGHFNSRGYEVMADAVFETFSEKRL